MNACLYVYPLAYLEKRLAEIHQFIVPVARVRRSDLIWRHCHMLCTSGFADYVTISMVSHVFASPRPKVTIKH